MEREFAHLGAFSPPILHDGQHPCLPTDEQHPDNGVVALQVDALHPLRGAPENRQIGLRKADRPAGLGDQHDLALTVGEAHIHYAVAFLQPRRDHTPRPWIREIRKLGPFHEAVLREEHDKTIGSEIIRGQHRDDRVASISLGQRVDRLPSRRSSPLGYIQHRKKMEMPILGEGEQPALRARHEDPLEIVVLEPLHPGQGLPG